MYSFAVVMWECINYTLPFPGILEEDFKTKIGIEKYRPQVLLSPNAAATEFIQTIIEKCWRHDSKERPSFRDLKERTKL